MVEANNPRNKTFVVERIGAGAEEPIVLKADRVESDKQTGRTVFYDGELQVGSFVNINFYVKS